MRTLTDTIRAEQIKNPLTQRAKLEVKTFGFPIDTQLIRRDKFDWHLVHQNASTGGGHACCASDGSLIITDGTTKTVRFATPGYSTDYTTWQPNGNPPGYTALRTSCIAANPTNGEVMIFQLANNKLYYVLSSDYGVSFGVAVEICAAVNYDIVSACYKPNGDICVVVGHDVDSLIPTIGICERVGGVWDAALTTKLIGLGGDVSFNYSHFISRVQYGTPSYSVSSCYIRNLSVSYDEDFFITMDYEYQSFNPSLDHHYDERITYSYKTLCGIWGDGVNVTADTWYPTSGGGFYALELTKSPTTDINSLKDLTNFGSSSISGSDIKRLSRISSMMSNRQRALISEKTSLFSGDSDAASLYYYSFVYKIANHPLLLSICNGDEVYVMSMDKETTVNEGTFDESNTIVNSYPLQLCANSTYVFAVNGNQIFMSPLPTDWQFPVAGSWTGTGEGASTLTITDDRIWMVNENVLDPQKPELSIVLDDHDDYFLESGLTALGITRKGQVKLYYGLDVGGTPEYSEAQTYYIKNWEHVSGSLIPNTKLFTLNLYNTWDLLDQFIFRKGFELNPYDNPNQYTLYQILELIVSVIGGTVSYTTRSNEMTYFCPRINVKAQETAASLLKRVLTSSRYFLISSSELL